MTFTVRLVIDGEGRSEIEYDSVAECLTDAGLRALFDGGHVGKCDVLRGGIRITGLPGALATWDRFRGQMESNERVLHGEAQ